MQISCLLFGCCGNWDTLSGVLGPLYHSYILPSVNLPLLWLQRQQNEELLARCEELQETLKEQESHLVEKEVRIEELLRKLKVRFKVICNKGIGS